MQLKLFNQEKTKSHFLILNIYKKNTWHEWKKDIKKGNLENLKNSYSGRLTNEKKKKHKSIIKVSVLPASSCDASPALPNRRSLRNQSRMYSLEHGKDTQGEARGHSVSIHLNIVLLPHPEFFYIPLFKLICLIVVRSSANTHTVSLHLASVFPTSFPIHLSCFFFSSN